MVLELEVGSAVSDGKNRCGNIVGGETIAKVLVMGEEEVDGWVIKMVSSCCCGGGLDDDDDEDDDDDDDADIVDGDGDNDR